MIQVPKSLLLQDLGRMTRHQHHAPRLSTPLPGGSGSLHCLHGLPGRNITCSAGLKPQSCRMSCSLTRSLVSLQQEDSRDSIFSSKKGAEGGCDGVGQQCEGCGRRSVFQPVQSLLGCCPCPALIFWLAMCTKFASEALPLFSHKR